MPNTRLVGIGAFVAAGVTLFALALFMIGNRRSLLSPRFEVHAEFAQLSGLTNGATVRVAGMNAGEVTAIDVPATASSRFRVTMRIREDLHVLVRNDSVATIQTEGVVGNKFVLIQAGTDGSARVASGGTIPSREPFEFADLLVQASDTIRLLNTTIDDVRDDVAVALKNIREVASQANVLLDDVSADITEISDSARRIGADTSEIIAGLRAGRGTVGKLLTDDEVYQRVRSITEEVEQAVRAVRESSEQVRAAVAGLNAGLEGTDGGESTSMMADLRVTAAKAREAMTDLAENAEALKRSFFFRGYFKQRGYYDLASLTPTEYRELTRTERVPLRIWLRADVLFSTGAAGLATLDDGGKARLDSAMSTFLAISRGTPIVVEGYASGGSTGEQYRVSLERATAAVGYLQRRYGIEPSLMAAMPLGADAKDSPGGERWEGIALTLLLDRDAKFVRPSAPGAGAAPTEAEARTSPQGVR